MTDDEWERDEDGSLRVSMLTGFATAFSPDGQIGVVRVTFSDDVEGAYPMAAQLAMRESAARDLGEALVALADKMRSSTN